MNKSYLLRSSVKHFHLNPKIQQSTSFARLGRRGKENVGKRQAANCFSTTALLKRLDPTFLPRFFSATVHSYVTSNAKLSTNC